MELTAEQVRVLGCLIEKERTTPDQYPLSTNALVAACNQRSSREPVVSYDDRAVDQAMLELRQLGLARTVRPTGTRGHKHRHVLDEAWHLDDEELAVLAVLMLRGAQTPGELRTRTERYIDLDMAAVEEVLARLAERELPLAANLGRRPGQSQDRWMHVLSGSTAAPSVPEASPPPVIAGSGTTSAMSPPATPIASDLEQRVADLEHRLAGLEDALARLHAELGL
jgi:uncharacterized protein YceH (UPF0502 family)